MCRPPPFNLSNFGFASGFPVSAFSASEQFQRRTNDADADAITTTIYPQPTARQILTSCRIRGLGIALER